jgi:hypothetical protein
MNTTATMATPVSTFGPYHGQFEGHARVFMILALVEAAGLIIFPWLIRWITTRHPPAEIYARALPMSPFWLALIDFLGVILAYSWYSLYRRLSTKISAGAPGYAFLDRVRLSIVLMAQTASALLILIALRVR